MNLIRVSYDKKDTPAELREYRIDGQGPVGCLNEYQKLFPKATLKIFEGTELMNTIEPKEAE